MRIQQAQQHTSGAQFLKYCGYSVFFFEILLGLAHFLWPDVRWGQGRSSYFHFANRLTLASWLASMQLAGVALCSLFVFHKERALKKNGSSLSLSWLWLVGSLFAFGLSFAEITRIHHRFNLFGYPRPGLYQLFILLPAILGLFIVFGSFLLSRLRNVPLFYKFGIGWLVMWGLERFVTTLSYFPTIILQQWNPVTFFLIGETYLFGCTLLFLAVGGYAIHLKGSQTSFNASDDEAALPPNLTGFRKPVRFLIMCGVGGTTASLIFVQVILFQLLTIFQDYLTANSIISIAMLGIAIGGLVAAYGNTRAFSFTIITGGMLFPFSILLAFGAIISLTAEFLGVALFLMCPFILGSTVITLVLARAKSHVVYFVDLIGAAVGALCVSPALWYFREENSLFVLAAFTSILSVCCIIPFTASSSGKRHFLLIAACVECLLFGSLGFMNMQHDVVNIIRTKIRQQYPWAQTLFSHSSFGGRYDIIRRSPDRNSLSAYENGRITDTIRERPTEYYQIDPRVPHTLMKDPSILILGLSGDGIIKTSKFLGKTVTGVEINPAVVRLQTRELAAFNANSYEGVQVHVMDARSFLAQTQEQYDMITLMNTHTARGRTAGRAPSPEYMDTYEAISSYLNHLTDNGVVIFEEPVNAPRREPAVWKLLVTMRQVLRDRGIADPQQHFFIFQWHTNTNNYIQIVMKKHPLSQEDISKLKQWIEDVDGIEEIEALRGQKMGPIRCKTTLLHSPDVNLSTNYARILRREVSQEFLRARNLILTTDDRPFHFDVDPKHPEIKKAYARTLVMTLALLPLLFVFLRRRHSGQKDVLIYSSAVILTGLGYFFIEVTFIQWCAIFLGTPVVTFSTILGTLLFFSGLGSLWSGRIRHSGLYAALGVIPGLLVLLQWVAPYMFALATAWSLWQKVALVMLSIAPLAFFMGVPFPFILRTGKRQFSPSAAPILFGINSAAGALAVPLSINTFTSYGFRFTFYAGICVYIVLGVLLLAKDRPLLWRPVWGITGIALLVGLLSPWLPYRLHHQNIPQNEAEYKVYGVRYGMSFYGEDRIVLGGNSSSSLPFAWMFWIIQGHGKTLLVDTGFHDEKLARRWRIFDYVFPVQQLKRFGIAPSDISDVILTHAHWDHIGSVSSFKHARIWMQRQEYEYLQSVLSEDAQQTQGFRQEDLQMLKALEQEQRLQLIDGTQTLVPGITMIRSGGHTAGSQYVRVGTLDGTVILSGDETYLYRNNHWHIPIGSAFDHQANIAAIQTMQGMAASPFYILPGHDPRVMDYFPRVADNIVRILAVPE